MERARGAGELLALELEQAAGHFCPKPKTWLRKRDKVAPIPRSCQEELTCPPLGLLLRLPRPGAEQLKIQRNFPTEVRAATQTYDAYEPPTRLFLLAAAGAQRPQSR